MSKIFTRTFRVRWGELEPGGTVSPANYLRYLIETAWDWGVAIGWAADYSQNPDVFWVIRETEIRFFHPLRHNDVFDFTIWMVNWQRVRGTRCFEMRFQESGDVIAQGTQQIVYMDAKTGRPMNLPEEEIARFWLENPRVFPFERFPKIAPAENVCTMQRQVESMDLDAYAQVNNVIYVSYAEEAAAQDFASRGWPPAKFAEANLAVATRRIHIQYSAITGWGEVLSIATHMGDIKDTGGSRYIRMTRTGGSPVAECIIDWDLVDRKSGEARPLPDELR
jgi:YbgC/YbaW family acyl-CoA thioester hydrolase